MQVLIDKSLEDYLSFADESTRAFLATPPAVFALVKDLDALIRDIFSGGMLETHPMPTFLNMNAYYSLLSGIRIAISGHVSSVFPLVRAALESASYAFLMTRDESLLPLWQNRDRSEQDRAACRKAFTSAVGKTAKALRPLQREMAEYVEDLYEASITFGAHPNPHSVMRHLSIREDGGNAYCKVDFTCMYGEGSSEITTALIACAEYGLFIAYLCIQESPSLAHVDALTARWNALNELKNSLAEGPAHSEATAGPSTE